LIGINAIFTVCSIVFPYMKEEVSVTESTTKLPIKTQPAERSAVRHPFESLRREVDRLFDDFHQTAWLSPFRGSLFDMEPFMGAVTQSLSRPAVDVVEKDNGFEIAAELPGLEPKNIEVTVNGDSLTIKGERQEQSEEKKKDYYLQERRFGSFERRFRLPDMVDASKIDATFKAGVLTITLPKKSGAATTEKKIDVKAA
jgi:HSP20 family protein